MVMTDERQDGVDRGNERKAGTDVGGSPNCSVNAHLVVVSNGATPYGLHFLRRVAKELPEFRLQTI